ncbi:hypothetical protein SteCoe_34433 [Stentor coeruleus]|uniref:Right handed beta helix domain-containing protein n=1 Tax=Stentor coeruleus TaxID=5963 RepID=A0A1R2AUR4_9CILI|nr:hypothetical protein SteCoe_34433 [Stentor coeruleus]
MILKLLSLVLHSFASLDLDFPFSCSSYACKSYELFDTSCNLLCMTPPCNFDSSDITTSSWYGRFISSGCFSSCFDLGCTAEMLQNSVCDTKCNIQECGFDLGVCGYCASGCTKSMLLNGIKDPACNTKACMYDNNAYGWCIEGCFQDDLNSTTCKSACDNAFCDYQNFVCDDSFCAPGCSPKMQNDTICYSDCNNKACDYNNWACACSDGCPIDNQYNTSVCFPECDNIDCNYQNGACGYCASGCSKDVMGDGNCNIECNIAECNYDWGDCGCSPGCDSKYDNNTGDWDWQGECKYECLVEDCLYNYGVCYDEFLIRSAWFMQILNGKSSFTLDFSGCESNSCLIAELENIENEPTSCSTACDIGECMYCMGLSQEISSCLRSAYDQCLICKDTKQIYDYCFSGECPDGFIEIPELNSTFLNTIICFKEPIKYSWSYYYELYISNNGNNSKNGSKEEPLETLHYALQKATRKFTKIYLSPGEYDYTKSNVVNILVYDSLSPLKFTVDLGLEELWIQGTDENDRPIVYIVSYPMQIYSQAKKTYIKNINFYGIRALNSECDNELCAYCAYIYNLGTYYLNDQFEYIEDLSAYALNCNDYNDYSFIITDSDTYLTIENTDFSLFGQQLYAIIQSSGSVTLKNVNFEDIIIQSKGAAIDLSCTSSCKSADFSYITGSVSKINNGYEYTEDKYQAGFLKITGYNNAYISNITFDYNMVITGYSGSYYNYLNHFVNLLGTVTIEYCTFSNSFLNGIVYLDDSSLTYTDFSIDYYGFIEQYNQMHFKFSNNVIRNVGALNFMVRTSSNFAQNIDISDITINEVAINGEGIFVIENLSAFTDNAIYGGWTYVKINGIYYVGFENPRYVKIKDITISSSYYGGNFLGTTFIPTFILENISVDTVSDFDYTKINSLVLKEFIDNDDMYIKAELPEGQIVAYTCTSLIQIAYSQYAILESIDIKNSSCSSGQNGLSANVIGELNITLLTLSSSQEESSNPAIYLDSISASIISNITLTDISKNECSIFHTNKVENLTIYFFEGKNLKSTYKSSLHLDSSGGLIIYDFKCEECESSYGDGGALYIIPNTKDSYVYLYEIVCISCHADYGSGGAIFLDSYSATLYHKVYISYFYVFDSGASDGVALFISSRVTFEDSKFSNFNVSSCLSKEGGIITDFHKTGTTYLLYYYSEDNIAYYSGVKGLYTYSGLLLKMENIWITRPKSISSSFYFYSIKDDSLVTISEMLVTDSTNVTAIESSKVNIEITGMTILAGQGIFVYESNLDIIYSTFESLYGYAITASSNSAITCKNCAFINIHGSSVLVFESDSYFTIEDSVFLNISSNLSPSVLIMNSCTSKSSFLNSEFSYSYSQNDALMSLQASSLSIKNCEIRNNTSSSISPGISIISSTVDITNTNFYDQTAILGGFIYMSTKSSVNITDSSFNRGKASGNGGAIYNVMSTATINNCFFSENYITSEYGTGGALCGITSANFYIYDSKFENNQAAIQGSTIYFEGDKIEIYNSVFISEPNHGQSYVIFCLNTIMLNLEDSDIRGNMLPGMYLEYVDSILISNTKFSNLLGAISIVSSNSTQSKRYIIEDSSFSNNSAIYRGGALNLYGASISISNTNFLNNSAVLGGGIYFECIEQNCGFTITSCNFTNNNADLEGGAIKWQDKRPKIDQDTTFTDNTAQYGGNFASIPAMLGKSKSRRLDDDILICTPALVCQQEIVIELLDSVGNIMTLDNSSTAVMSISSNSENSESYSVSGTVKSTAINGIFTFDSFIISGQPETDVIIAISTTTIDPALGLAAEDTVKYSDSIFFTVNLTACENGQQIIETGCSNCLSGTYVMEPQSYCISCPSGGNCTGGWRIYAEAGYWKPYDNATIVYKCPLSAACLGSANDTDFVGSCAVGYEGKKCYSCIVGYTRSGTSKCAKCPSQASNAVILLFLMLFIIFIGVVLVRSTIKSAYSPKALHSIYIKIFTNYIQLVFLTTQFELEWPWFVLKLFSAQTTVATASDKIFSLDCYFSGSNVDFESTYYSKLIITAVTPLIIWAIGFLVWVLICLSKKSWKYLKRELLTTEIVLFFLIYPNIVKFMFTAFSCTYIKGQGYYMRDNLIIKCWADRHLKYTLGIALPSVIIWAVGVPTAVLVILIKRRNHLKSDANKVIFGFIFNGYKQSRFFWEFSIMYRKIIIICISVFMNEVAQSIQALTLIIVLIATLYLQYEFKPYNKHQLNHMETEAIFTATITIYCGMYYLTQEISEGFGIILFIIILCGNMYFILYWGYFMLQAVFDMLSALIPMFKKLTGKNDPYPLVIMDEKKVHQGVYKDEEEGIYKFTLIEKTQSEDSKLVKLEGIENMDDLFKDVCSRYAENLNFSFVKVSSPVNNSFEDKETISLDNK